MPWFQHLISMHDYYTGNIAAIILSMVLLSANRGNPGKKPGGNRTEHYILQHLIWNVILYALVEIASCIPEELPGTGITVLLYLLNSLLYILNMLLAFSWVVYIIMHLGYRFSKRVWFVLSIPLLCGIVLLAANAFTPLVFVIRDNVYETAGQFGWFFPTIAEIYLLYSLFIYLICLHRGGTLKYFPVWAYIVPIVVGMFLDQLLGNSFISVCNAIALCAVLATRQREDIFRDELTGLYNRAYLEELKAKLERERNPYVSGIMLDLNDFKSINDNLGHAEGDEALVIVADLLRRAVGSFGDVIRYAGDEFVIILNTWDESRVKDCRRRIQQAFDDFNARKTKPYLLSAGMGSANFNADTQTVNEFMNTIDRNMYEDKRRYYADHERRKN